MSGGTAKAAPHATDSTYPMSHRYTKPRCRPLDRFVRRRDPSGLLTYGTLAQPSGQEIGGISAEVRLVAGEPMIETETSTELSHKRWMRPGAI